MTYTFFVENQTLFQVYENIFNVIAALFQSPVYLEIIKLAFLLGGFYAFLLMVLSLLNIEVQASPFKKTSIFIAYLFTAFALLVTTFSVDKATVIIKTNQLASYCAINKNNNVATKVDNVPWIWAYTFTGINELGHSLSNMANTVFGDTEGRDRGHYVEYVQAAGEILKMDFKNLANHKTNNVNETLQAIKQDCILIPASKSPLQTQNIINTITATGDIRKTLSHYFSDEASLIAFQNPTSPKATDMGSAQIDGIKPKNFLVSVNGETMTCGALWTKVNDTIASIQQGSTLECSGILKDALTPSNLSFFMGEQGQTPPTSQMRSILTQAGLLNVFMEQKSNLPSEIKFATGKSMAQTTTNFVGTGFYMAKMLPILQMGLRAILYAFIPFTFIIIMLPYGTQVLTQYLKTLIWVELWSPVAAVLSMFLKYGGVAKFYEAYNVTGMNMANASYVYHEAFVLAGVAGYLYMSIPALTWVVLRHSADMLGNILQGYVSSIQANFSTQAVNEDIKGLQAVHHVNSERRARGQELMNLAEMDKLQAGQMAANEAGQLAAFTAFGAARTFDAAQGKAITQNYRDLGLYDASKDQSNLDAARTSSYSGVVKDRELATNLGLMDKNGNINKQAVDNYARTKGVEELSKVLGEQAVQGIYSPKERAEMAALEFTKRYGDSQGLSKMVTTKLDAVGGYDNLISQINKGGVEGQRALAQGIAELASKGVWGQMYTAMSNEHLTQLMFENGIGYSQNARNQFAPYMAELLNIEQYAKTVKENNATFYAQVTSAVDNVYGLSSQSAIHQGYFAKSMLEEFNRSIKQASDYEAYRLLEKYFGDVSSVISQKQTVALLQSVAMQNVYGDNLYNYLRIAAYLEMLSPFMLAIGASNKFARRLFTKAALGVELTKEERRYLKKWAKRNKTPLKDFANFREAIIDGRANSVKIAESLQKDIDVAKGKLSELNTKYPDAAKEHNFLNRVEQSIKNETKTLTKRIQGVKEAIMHQRMKMVEIQQRMIGATINEITNFTREMNILGNSQRLLTIELDSLTNVKLEQNTKDLKFVLDEKKAMRGDIKGFSEYERALNKISNLSEKQAQELLKQKEIDDLIKTIGSDKIEKLAKGTNRAGKVTAVAMVAGLATFVLTDENGWQYAKAFSKVISDEWEKFTERNANTVAFLHSPNSPKTPAEIGQGIKERLSDDEVRLVPRSDGKGYDIVTAQTTDPKESSYDENEKQQRIKLANELVDIRGRNHIGGRSLEQGFFALNVAAGFTFIVPTTVEFYKVAKDKMFGSGASLVYSNDVYEHVMKDFVNANAQVKEYFDTSITMIRQDQVLYSVNNSMKNFKEAYKQGFTDLSQEEKDKLREIAPEATAFFEKLNNDPVALEAYVKAVHESKIGLAGMADKESIEIIRSTSPVELNEKVNKVGLHNVLAQVMISGLVTNKSVATTSIKQTFYTKTGTQTNSAQLAIVENELARSGKAINPELKEFLALPTDQARFTYTIDKLLDTPLDLKNVREVDKFFVAMIALEKDGALTKEQRLKLETKAKRAALEIRDMPSMSTSYLMALGSNNFSDWTYEVHKAEQERLKRNRVIAEKEYKKDGLDSALDDGTSNSSVSLFAKDERDIIITLTTPGVLPTNHVFDPNYRESRQELVRGYNEQVATGDGRTD